MAKRGSSSCGTLFDFSFKIKIVRHQLKFYITFSMIFTMHIIIKLPDAMKERNKQMDGDMLMEEKEKCCNVMICVNFLP